MCSSADNNSNRSGASSTSAATTPKLDPAMEPKPYVKPSPMPEAAFEENIAILKKMSFRGLRAFGMIIVGLTSLHLARNYRKAKMAEGDGATAAKAEDATDRYLQEMSSMGWPVEENEEAVKKMQQDEARKAK
eukprot:PhM_4_TR12422/c0_g1_i1/m.86823